MSRSTSRLVAHPSIFRMFMMGKFDAYVPWPLSKSFQNWIVDRSTARNFTVCLFQSPEYNRKSNLIVCSKIIGGKNMKTTTTQLDIAGSSNCKKEWQNTVIYGKCFGQIQFRQEILWENWSDLWCMARENLSHFFIGFFKRGKRYLGKKLTVVKQKRIHKSPLKSKPSIWENYLKSFVCVFFSLYLYDQAKIVWIVSR